MAVAAYSLSIASVNTLLPGTIPPDILQDNPSLSLDIVQGAPLHPSHLLDAERGVQSLINHAGAPQNVVVCAKSYAAAIALQHSVHHCSYGVPATNLGNIIPNILQNQTSIMAMQAQLTQVENGQQQAAATLAQIQATLAQTQATLDQIQATQVQMQAEGKNVRIYSKNIQSRSNTTLRSEYPFKEISGNGLLRSNAVFGPDVLVPQMWQPPVGGAPLNTRPPAAIAPVDPYSANYTLSQLKGLVVFYNEDFGMVIGDNKGQRIKKFRTFICGEA